MNFSRIACCIISVSFVSAFSVQTVNARERANVLTGISLAGAEFGTDKPEFSNTQPGRVNKAYTFPTARTIEYFARAGTQLIRIPFRWERIQPTPGGELDAEYLRGLKTVCKAAADANVFVLLDVHNYGRYRLNRQGSVREWIIDQQVHGVTPVNRRHFADLWRRLANEFHDDHAVVAYGLMNEPHDMGSSNWKEISQLAVDAIRQIDEKTAIAVCGDDWASAERFEEANGPKPWIDDPSNCVVYEAHCYFDEDGSGKYKRTFEEELSQDAKLRDRGVDRVEPFLRWCGRNHVRGFVGEYGSPRESGWRTVTERFLDACNASNVGVCYWAAGEWWGDYPLSVQPHDVFTTTPQLEWLQRLHGQTKVSSTTSRIRTRTRPTSQVRLLPKSNK